MSPDQVHLGQYDHRVVQRQRVFEEHEQKAQVQVQPSSE
jgi:hypothetical protein